MSHQYHGMVLSIHNKTMEDILHKFIKSSINPSSKHPCILLLLLIDLLFSLTSDTPPVSTSAHDTLTQGASTLTPLTTQGLTLGPPASGHNDASSGNCQCNGAQTTFHEVNVCLLTAAILGLAVWNHIRK